MTRPQRLLTALLDVLADWDEPLDEAIIHAQINATVKPIATIAEFTHALEKARHEGWISELPSTRRGALWFLTHLGRAERHR